MFNRQITLQTAGTLNENGEPTVEDSTVWARVDGSTREYYDVNVQSVVSNDLILIEPDATVTVNDRVYFDSRAYEIVSCQPVLNKDNEIEQWQVVIR